MKKIRFYISPYFLIRHYLNRDIGRLVDKYDFKGKLIDIGCGNKPYRDIFKKISSYEGIDFKDFSVNKDCLPSKPEFYFEENYLKDLRLNFKDDSFDVSVSFQVLEHHKNPKLFIEEMLRITKCHGYVMISFPLVNELHEIPNDYFRFTEFGLREMLCGLNCELLEVKRQGGILSVIYKLLNGNLNYFASKNRFNYFLAVMVFPVFLVFQYVALFIDRIINNDIVFANYLVLIKKG
jgi:SAM-dependent methyltransferase